MVLAVDVASGTTVGTALLNPPEGTAAGHGAAENCAHLGFVAVDPSQVRQSVNMASGQYHCIICWDYIIVLKSRSSVVDF